MVKGGVNIGPNPVRQCCARQLALVSISRMWPNPPSVFVLMSMATGFIGGGFLLSTRPDVPAVVESPSHALAPFQILIIT